MLVIDGIELTVIDHILRVGRLDNGDTLRGQHDLDAAHEIISVGHMREDVIGVKHIGALFVRAAAG